MCREAQALFGRADRGGAQASRDGYARVDVIWKIGISEQTFYRWKKQYTGLQSEQVRRFKRLQEESAQLKLVAELSLDKVILQGINSKNVTVRR